MIIRIIISNIFSRGYTAVCSPSGTGLPAPPELPGGAGSVGVETVPVCVPTVNGES